VNLGHCAVKLATLPRSRGCIRWLHQVFAEGGLKIGRRRRAITGTRLFC